LTVLDLVAAGAAGARLRILLLARTAGEWWERLPSRLHGPAKPLALSAGRFELLPDGAAPGDPEEAFRGAVLASAAALRGEQDGASRPDLADPLFGNVLFVHASALLALEPRSTRRDLRSRDELLAGVLGREDASRWHPSWKARELPLDPLVR